VALSGGVALAAVLGTLPASRYVPLRDMSVRAGDGSRLKFEDESPLLEWGGRGETSVVAGSEKTSDGVSMSGV